MADKVNSFSVYGVSKRLLDIIISLLFLSALLPLLLIVAALLRFTGEGKILYFQERIGKDCRYFKIWKFATMLEDSSNFASGNITLRNDPRVTAVGKYLRITKFNELPQLVNVLLGDMTLVGPRPTVRSHANMYPAEVMRKIYSIKPGITGIASILFRDEESLISKSNMRPVDYYEQVLSPQKASLELWYLRNRSILLDLKILFVTLLVIFFPNSDLMRFFFRNTPFSREV